MGREDKYHEFERMMNQGVIAYLKILSQCSHGRTKENLRNTRVRTQNQIPPKHKSDVFLLS